MASKNPEVWYSYGSFLSRMGDVGKAVEAFKEVVALDPGNLDGLLCLASLLWEVGIHRRSPPSFGGVPVSCIRRTLVPVQF